MSYTPPQHRILDQTTEDNRQVHAIEFLDGQYEGLIFSYGRVELLEDELADELKVKFEYDVHRNAYEIYEKDETGLVPYLGDFLVALIGTQMEAEELIYAGGTDTKRPTRDE